MWCDVNSMGLEGKLPAFLSAFFLLLLGADCGPNGQTGHHPGHRGKIIHYIHYTRLFICESETFCEILDEGFIHADYFLCEHLTEWTSRVSMNK